MCPAPRFWEKDQPGNPHGGVSDVRAQKLILTAYQHAAFGRAGISAISARFSPAATAQGR